MSGLDYKKAGVDIEGGDAWVDVVKGLIAKRGDALPAASRNIGGFSGLYPIGGGRAIAACCDGVGTKVELAALTGIYRGLGQDLVAMSVNDLVTCGAEPLFFLDYIACGKLDARVMEEVMEGILDACCESHCALLGGETAEMPGVYPESGFDLAGFAVGIVDEAKVISGRDIREGDVIVGLPSSGVHSNGFSLVRKALADEIASDAALREDLMLPTRVYVRQALAAIAAAPVKGMAHITGGGLEANIDRVIHGGLRAKLEYGTWKRLEVFDRIARAGVAEDEMRRVFNLGVGYIFITDADSAGTLASALAQIGEEPSVVGKVTRRS